MSDEKKIFIDDDWKSQVAAEKESLKQEATAAQQSAAGAPTADGAPVSGTTAETTPDQSGPVGSEPAGKEPVAGEQAATGQAAQMPPASLEMLVTTLATEAMVALGQFPNPATQEVSLSIEHASYAIDMLGMLEEKTKGNLTPEEAAMMTDLLHQLRMMYMAVQQTPPNA